MTCRWTRRYGDASSFTTNPERFEKHGLIRTFFDRVVEGAYAEKLASSEHFTVDGTLIESYGSCESGHHEPRLAWALI